MPDGPGGFTQDFSCPALLRIPLRFASLRVRSSHALWPSFPGRSARDVSCDHVVLLPRRCRNIGGLGSSPFARHYWGNHCCFLFLQVLRCFSSLRWPPALPDGIPSGYRVVPFGDPRVKGYLRLAAAFRSLSRPSSPPRAKASTRRPCFLLFRDRVPDNKTGGGLILSALTFFRCSVSCAACHRSFACDSRVENNGFEPLTPCLQSRCSSQLS